MAHGSGSSGGNNTSSGSSKTKSHDANAAAATASGIEGLATLQATPGWTRLYNRPGKDAILYHVARPTEKWPGCQAIIVRRGCHLPSYLNCHRGFAEHLKVAGQQASAEGPSALVFLQNAPACLAFTSYEQAPEKLVITGTNYIRILDFFEREYDRLCSKIQLEMGAMAAAKDLVRINHQLYFIGAGTSNYQMTLNPHDKEHLILRATGNSDTGYIETTIGYADDSLGSIALHGRALTVLAKSRHDIRDLIDPPLADNPMDILELAVQAAVAGYKEGPSSKRARQ
jgi:hypothetical protein